MFVIGVNSPLKRWAIVSALFTILGVIGFLFFLACGLLYARRLLSSRPLLRIDADGIFDNASAVSVGYLSWSEIQDVKIIRVARQRFLSIYVADPTHLKRQSSVARRFILWINEKRGWGTANIPESILPLPLENIADEIESRRRTESP